MELVLAKGKLMKVHKMLVIRYNFKNKYKGIRDNNRTKMPMLIINNKMIFK
jgi:hypothetical protein